MHNTLSWTHQNFHKNKGKIQQGGSLKQHFNPSTSNSLHNVKTTGHTLSNGQLPEPHRISHQKSKGGQNRTRKAPPAHTMGPMQNIHPITKETCEQIIHYITEVATNEEPQTYNKNMENLSNTLEDITKISRGRLALW